MKAETKTIDIILKSLKIEYLAPSNVLLRPYHESDTYMKRSLNAINQYNGGEQIFQNKGERECIVKDGDAVLIRAGRFYRSVNLQTGNTRRRGISFRFAIMGGQDPLSLLETPFVMDKKAGDFVAHLSKELFAAESQANFLLGAARRAGIGMRLLEKIIEVSQLKSDAVERLEYYSRLQTVFEYIRQNLNKQISVEILAKLAGLSESRFFYVFHNASGLSPNQYLLQVRLNRAQELLAGELAINKISELTGFNDPFYFSRIFKSKIGMSPRLFRERNRQGKIEV